MKKPNPKARIVRLTGTAYWQWVADGVVWRVEVGGYWRRAEVPE